MTDAPTPANIFQIGFGFWASKVLLSAVELGVFTELAKGPADLATLSGRLGLHERLEARWNLIQKRTMSRNNGVTSISPITFAF